MVFIIFGTTLPVAARAWPSTVLSVGDGDTMTVAPCGDASSPVVVRLYGVDAPEADQPGGGEAVEMVPFDTDKYGRAVTLVMCKGTCVNAALVGAGLAWMDPRHCRARKAGLGLWAAPAPHTAVAMAQSTKLSFTV